MIHMRRTKSGAAHFFVCNPGERPPGRSTDAGKIISDTHISDIRIVYPVDFAGKSPFWRV